MRKNDRQSEFDAAWNKLLTEISPETETAAFGIQLKHVYEMLLGGGEGFTERQALRIVAYGLFHQDQDQE
jgi:hypothetical protein